MTAPTSTAPSPTRPRGDTGEQMLLIPKGAFKTFAFSAEAGKWASYGASPLLLRWGTMFLGITRYQLGKLLGTKDPSAVYRWLSGDKRPSQIFLARMLWLIKLRVEGQSPVLWRSINWETGEISFR